MKYSDSTLKEIAEIILFENDYKRLNGAIHSLRSLCEEYSGILCGEVTDEDIYLKSGKAISPTKAALCLLEGERTRKFIRGIYRAIVHLKEVFGSKIHILYAGTGPYSTLVLPLTACFTPNELTFSLLDINQISLSAVKCLYENLNLTAYVTEFINADAATYKIPPGKDVHLIISETMQNALKKEPQVEIMLNLIPQLPQGAVFVPQEIAIDAYLISSSEEQRTFIEADAKPNRVNLGNVYKIGQDNCMPPQPVTLKLTDKYQTHKQVSLFTEIKVFDFEKLSTYDCSLTLPHRVHHIGKGKPLSITFDYTLGEVPGFKHEVFY